MFENLKIKLRNKYFWVSLISLVLLLLEQLNINIDIDINAISSTILSILVLLGIINDNGYDKNNNGIDDRLEEDKNE